ncbi:MAG TPA: ankyrin repeat domain-containing protein [Blastocatellia bacterium]|nr:ankyrin repeat domain-containing protein [Blastocatellia bacterium]
MTRKVSRIAAGAFTVALSLSSTIIAQQSKAEPGTTSVSSKKLTDRQAAGENGSSISGTVIDANGAVIAGASITLVNQSIDVSYTATTDEDGIFKFSNLDVSLYLIKVAASGFKTTEVKDVNVTEGKELRPKISLQVSGDGATVGGAMIVEPTDLLVRAAKDDNLEGLNVLLDLGMDVNKVDDLTGTTALYHAVENNNKEMVRTLLAAGAKINGVEAPDEEDKSKLVIHAPALLGITDNTSVDLVEELLTDGADVNIKDWRGDSAIIAASYSKNLPVILKLIQLGANPNDRDSGNRTPLMYAASRGQLDIIKALIAAGADPNSQDTDGKTALGMSFFEENKEITKALLDAGANPNLKENDGEEALANFVLADDAEHLVPMLLEAGAKVNDSDNDGTTPLMNAARSGQLMSVKLLVQAGADINAKDKDGDTALKIAIASDNKGSNADVILFLRLNGATE